MSDGTIKKINMKPKVLLLKNDISSYNVPIYNTIAANYDLTVAYYRSNGAKEKCLFKLIKLNFSKLGPFIFIKGICRLTKQYDLVSFVPDPHVFSYCILPFLPHKYGLLNWSIGFRVSYTHPYITDRKHTIIDKLYQTIFSRCDASIFYMEKAKEFWKNSSLDMDKVFVAPNTTLVKKIDIENKTKKDFLFVGTLYKGKGLEVLLDSYKKAIDNFNHQIPKLRIVGEGEMRPFIEDFIRKNKLENNISLEGAIFDENVLAEQFKKAILCFSPLQAGLSVPKSMGYGVPFVTQKNAITGGELYHITSGENGVMYDNSEELVEIMKDAILDSVKYINMGIAAQQYYYGKATVDHMAQGAISAFDFVLSKRENN